MLLLLFVRCAYLVLKLKHDETRSVYDENQSATSFAKLTDHRICYMR